MKHNRTFLSAISLFVCVLMCISFSGCGKTVMAADLMEGLKKGNTASRAADEKFTDAGTALALKLFAEAQKDSGEENLLISPLSVWLALSMTANGASGETLAQMESLLGNGIALDELNEYLCTFRNSLCGDGADTLKIANSIWFKASDEYPVNTAFLQKNADYYGADAYSSKFDKETVDDINNWVSKNTNGMIKELISSIDAGTLMYIINAMAFEAEWSKPYDKQSISDGIFTDINGAEKQVKMMSSSEMRYIETDTAKGFLKNYKGGRYSFAALLPDESIPIGDFIASLDCGTLKTAFENEKSTTVNAFIPKFSYSYDTELRRALQALGMTDAFDENADFSGITGKKGDICIDSVIHKTFISVDELGTKAGAVTSVKLKEMAMDPTDAVTVRLDRPFVYMIIDNETDIPVFIGAVMSI